MDLVLVVLLLLLLVARTVDTYSSRCNYAGICCSCLLPETFTGPTSFAQPGDPTQQELERDESARLLNARSMDRV